MGLIVDKDKLTPATRPSDRAPKKARPRRRILLISDRLDQPREQVQVRLLKNALAENGEEVALANWQRLHNGWSDLVDPSSLLARGFFIADRYRKLNRAMMSCDLIHVRYAESLGLIAMAMIVSMAQYLGRPVICDIRNHDIEALIESIGRSEKWLFDRCAAIVVSSDYHRSMLRGIDIGAELVVDSVDRSRFTARRIERVQPNLISVRPLEPEYNVSGLVKAFAIVKQKYPRAELTIVGDGSRRPVIEGIIAEENVSGIALTGQLDHDEVVRLMSAADVYVNPAGLDSVPVSMLEALASGLPVVSTDAGGVESIITDGENGLLAAAFSPPALADRIIELVDKPELAAQLSSRAPWSLSGTPWLEDPAVAWAALYDRILMHHHRATRA